MRQADIVTLFDYSYWANRQVLTIAAEISDEQFAAPSEVTWHARIVAPRTDGLEA